ncbi:MAG: hypothetical protein A2X22_04320 [Bacteroidetes bacterium GWF2_49_14]|nr:MAG: hypothetical protein A2X22_04320 [Bacteroidetes bacterium GWF2_49_14]HBB92701.1 hypothetical protein [Bacteroidales bacterium]
MYKYLFLLGLGIANPHLYSGLKAQTTEVTGGIWFKSANTAPKRFLYSQTILWPSSIAAHTYLYIKEDVDVTKAVSLQRYRRTYTLPPVWDRDHWSWNYGVHPVMGSFSYLAYRNRQAHWLEAFAGATINSAIYEYVIAGGTQQPSYNDLIVTPILGSLLGEGIYQVKKKMLRDKNLKLWEKIVITVTDPFESFYYGFNFNKMIRAQYR